MTADRLTETQQILNEHVPVDCPRLNNGPRLEEGADFGLAKKPTYLLSYRLLQRATVVVGEDGIGRPRLGSSGYNNGKQFPSRRACELAVGNSTVFNKDNNWQMF